MTTTNSSVSRSDGRSSAYSVEEAPKTFVKETAESRFRMTELLEQGGRYRYGLWEPPYIPLNGQEPAYTVTPDMEGRPDRVSTMFYGTPFLWWVIASVNNIMLPMRDMVAGMQLIIPTIDQVNSALQRVRK